jgi:hypothetical protein
VVDKSIIEHLGPESCRQHNRATGWHYYTHHLRRPPTRPRRPPPQRAYMAHKPEISQSLSSAFTQIPPTLSASDKLLSSILTLPPDPCIVYATYSPSGLAPHCEVLESARRQLVSRNQTCSFQDSILPHVHIDRDVSTFHVFVVASDDQVDNSLSTLKHLALDDMISEHPQSILIAAPSPTSCLTLLTLLQSQKFLPSLRMHSIRAVRHVQIVIPYVHPVSRPNIPHFSPPPASSHGSLSDRSTLTSLMLSGHAS